LLCGQLERAGSIQEGRVSVCHSRILPYPPPPPSFGKALDFGP